MLYNQCQKLVFGSAQLKQKRAIKKQTKENTFPAVSGRTGNEKRPSRWLNQVTGLLEKSATPHDHPHRGESLPSQSVTVSDSSSGWGCGGGSEESTGNRPHTQGEQLSLLAPFGNGCGCGLLRTHDKRTSAYVDTDTHTHGHTQ